MKDHPLFLFLIFWGIFLRLPGYVFAATVIRFCGCRDTTALQTCAGTTPISAGCRAVPLGQPHIIVLRQTKFAIILHAAARVRQPYRPARGTTPTGLYGCPIGAAAYHHRIAANKIRHHFTCGCQGTFCGYRDTFFAEAVVRQPTALRGDDTHPAGCRAVPLGQPHYVNHRFL